MSKKKVVLIGLIIGAIIAAIAGFLIYRYVMLNREKQFLKNLSMEFAEKWGTYTSQITEEYLEKLQPHLSQGLEEEMRDIASTLNSITPQGKNNYYVLDEPITTKSVSVEIKEFEGGSAKINVNTLRKIPPDYQERSQIIYLEFIKENNDWKVNKVEAK